MTSYRPKIMGIVNVTPDSFSDGGTFFDTKKAIEHSLTLIEDGADVLDIGGESTRPGALPVSIEEELERVVPVIEGLRKKTDVPISIDTRNARVMQEALRAGATMINDVSALSDVGALEIVSLERVPVCLMHMHGEPGTMQENPEYDNVVEEVYDFLHNRITACEAAGISKEYIYIDVGIGFGKTLEHNLTLLRNLARFKDLGTKMLLGTSRKGFIGKIAGEQDPEKRIAGSLASIVPGLEAGVNMFRVHDVFETKQFIEVFDTVKN